jgi:hypothetical protein
VTLKHDQVQLLVYEARDMCILDPNSGAEVDIPQSVSDSSKMLPLADKD